MEESMEVFDRAENIPKEWDNFCKDNFYMLKRILEFLEEVNPCKQKYYMVFNKNKEIEACFVMFPFKYEFSKRIKLNVNLIFLPVSVADPGIVAKPESKALSNCLKKIKGIKLILSTSQDFNLLNGIRYDGNPNCMMDIRWNTFEDYLENMRCPYRQHVKEVINKRKGLTKRMLKSPEEFTEDMYDLYRQIMSHVDYVLEILPLEFFRNHFSKTIVFELEGKPKAFIQFTEVGQKIIYEFGGLNYQDRDKYALYRNLILAPIEYAIENGFQTLDIGQSAEGTKLKFGSYLEPKYSWIFYNGNKICNSVLKFILLRNHTKRKEYPYHVFKKN